LTGLAEIIDYPARDMTVTVQTGITVGRLQEILRGENQQLAVDVPRADRATLGGALAVNAGGPRRLGHGTLRDYVIGISYVNDRGEPAKAGGRVVKNVAGYDLCKLHIGALGTLGVVTQVTLKLRPLPERRLLAPVPCPQAADLGPLLDRLHASQTRPVSATVRRSPDSGWQLLVGFEGGPEAVQWQWDTLQSELAPDWACATPRGEEAETALRRELADFPAEADRPLTFKANLLPGATAAFCQQAVATFGDELLLQAEAGNGIVVGHAPTGLTLEQAQTMLNTLRQHANGAHGNLVLTRCPTAWKSVLPVWGTPRGDRELMRAVKTVLDPADLFNPGRFLV
jgi:glycolate oxidase FAD binding subunit